MFKSIKCQRITINVADNKYLVNSVTLVCFETDYMSRVPPYNKITYLHVPLRSLCYSKQSAVRNNENTGKNFLPCAISPNV